MSKTGSLNVRAGLRLRISGFQVGNFATPYRPCVLSSTSRQELLALEHTFDDRKCWQGRRILGTGTRHRDLVVVVEVAVAVVVVVAVVVAVVVVVIVGVCRSSPSNS